MTVRLLSCKNCTAEISHIQGTLNVADIRVIAEPPILTVTQDPLTRGQSATFEVKGAPQSTISNWRYETSQPALGTITRSTNTGAMTWPGTVVAGGTGKVNVLLLGQTYNLEKSLSVSARSGWAFAAAPANQEANGYTIPGIDGGPGQQLLVPNPPVAGSQLGQFAVRFAYSLTPGDVSPISDNGPNQGLKYVVQIIDQASAHFVIAQDMDNLSSPFAQTQCGNWNGSTGYIGGPDLKEGAIRHEGGGANSHWRLYKDAQDNPANNLGVGAEEQVGGTALTLQQFVNAVKTALNNRASAIDSAYRATEPCAPNFDSTCAVYRGPVNYTYQCP